MKGSPAYYRPEGSPEHAHLGQGQRLAVETMLRTVRSSTAFAPLGVYVPWAKQNGAVNWATVDADHEIVVYPITAETIARVNAASYGSEVPWVAVITDKPVQALAAEQAWDATRYDQFTVEAVYDVDDARPAPRIRFLYWAKLHDDVGGGRDSLDAVARRLGGQLVFPVQIGIMGKRPPPPLPFDLVLDAQLAAASRPPGAASMPVAAPAAPAPTKGLGALGTSGWTPWLLVAGAAGLAWAALRPKRGAR